MTRRPRPAHRRLLTPDESEAMRLGLIRPRPVTVTTASGATVEPVETPAT